VPWNLSASFLHSLFKDVWAWCRRRSPAPQNADETEDEIRITRPQQRAKPETLQDPEPWEGKQSSFVVEGTLRRLPQDHEIWLLTRDEISGQVWPQTQHRVAFDAIDGRWSGRVVVDSGSRIAIIAVVAPPTSQDFFAYYRKNGPKTGWAALDRVPPECNNQHSLSAVAPIT
jgi:hypothetical protein